MCFAYCYFAWVLELHSAGWCMCKVWRLLTGGKFLCLSPQIWVWDVFVQAGFYDITTNLKAKHGPQFVCRTNTETWLFSEVGNIFCPALKLFKWTILYSYIHRFWIFEGEQVEDVILRILTSSLILIKTCLEEIFTTAISLTLDNAAAHNLGPMPIFSANVGSSMSLG